jgi:hypothetical protein
MPTVGTIAQPVSVQVSQYRVARIRAGQALLPFAIIASIFARRSLESTAVAIAVALQLAAIISLLSARRSLGAQPFSVQDGKGKVATQLVLARQRVLRWTVTGNVVRLYCGDMSRRLACRSEDEQLLVESLTGRLGRPVLLKRRGSDKARLLAGAAATVGLICTVAAFTFQSVPAVLIGLPMFVVGLAVFAALSQRVATVNSRDRLTSIKKVDDPVDGTACTTR